MNILQTIRQANRPGPPEHSVALRIGSCGAVVVAIVACQREGELNLAFAAITIAFVIAGNVFSYIRRATPFPLIKLVLAAVMIAAFIWFFLTVSVRASAGDLATVEGPLATLFTAMQAAHSFDVPSRRDLGFSLAGSATLMAVAAAQAISPAFGLLVVAWAAFAVVGLVARWGSMVGGARARASTIATSIVVAVVAGVVLIAVLPAPRAASGLVLPSSIGGGVPVDQPSHLVRSTAGTNDTSASPSGPTGVGGFLGFAGPLNTALRGSLGNQVVLRVRADRPTFWIAETYDHWTGQSWIDPVTGKQSTRYRSLTSGPPFAIPIPRGQRVKVTASASVSADYQTFYVAAGGSDLVLHADRATDVWFPSRRIFVAANGTIKAGASLGSGSIYTVLSSVVAPTDADLLASSGTTGLAPSVKADDLELPHPYPRVATLAAKITAHQTTTYGKVLALESWMGAHTKYTTDIPPLKTGEDTVDQFLFVERRGFCEQISTSLAVMLRTLGIPAREATGYVPGPYDPITDLYQVEAKDAHAWVQVWFPGVGWQSFDPTALVPSANPTPAEAIGHDIAAAASAVPMVPTIPLAVLVVVVAIVVWWRRRRPATWQAAVTSELERACQRMGFGPEPSDTLVTMARRLDELLDPSTSSATDVAIATERAAWRGIDPDPERARALVHDARHVRRRSRRRLRSSGRR